MSGLALVLGLLLVTSIALLRGYWVREDQLRQLLQEARAKLPAAERWDRFDLELSPERSLTVFVPDGLTQEEAETCILGFGRLAGRLGQSLPAGKADELFGQQAAGAGDGG